LLLSITTFASGSQFIVEVLNGVARRVKGGWAWYILNAFEIYHEEWKVVQIAMVMRRRAGAVWV